MEILNLDGNKFIIIFNLFNLMDIKLEQFSIQLEKKISELIDKKLEKKLGDVNQKINLLETKLQNLEIRTASIEKKVNYPPPMISRLKNAPKKVIW